MIPRIREVHLRNYRSIKRAVVHLSDLTVLVGPNGSGKSNFLDALAFVQECLSTSIEAALRSRGGLQRVRYGYSEGDADPVGLRVVVELSSDAVADYAFELASSGLGLVEVLEERCVISVRGKEPSQFDVRRGAFVVPVPGIRSAIEPDRLALYAASGVEEFRPLYDFLTGLRAYSIQPGKMRELRDPESGLVLDPDGGNAAAVLRNLHEHSTEAYRRIKSVLGSVVPGMTHVEGATVGGKQFLFFAEQRNSGDLPLGLFPTSVSDGTLRMLGLLLAAYQPARPTMLLVEEPEATIHPAAVDALMAVMLDAAKRSQVVLTTHSADLLDYKAVPDGSIRVVTRTGSGTLIAPVANSSREAIRKRLYSPGELLRSDELNPDLVAAESLSSEASLFGAPVRTVGDAA